MSAPSTAEGIGYIATVFGAVVGFGSSPERACRIAQLLGVTRCETRVAHESEVLDAAEELGHRRWSTERDLLDRLREAQLMRIWTREDLGDSTDDLDPTLDAIRATIAELDAAPRTDDLFRGVR